MKRGCLLALGLFLALVVGYYTLFRDRYDPPAPSVAALVGSVVTSMGVGLVGTGRQAREDARAIAAALAGRPREDGKLIAAVGTVAPLGPPLVAPFSGRPCVAYEYDATPLPRLSHRHRDRSGGGGRSGFALTPAVVRTPTGDVRILGFPFPEGEERRARVTGPEVIARARAYLEATPATDLSGFAVGKIFGEVKDVMTDDDGAVRKDWRMKDVDVERSTLSEGHLEVGTEVVVLGLWSQARGGIVPNIAGEGMANRLLHGRGDRVLAARRGRARSHVIAGLLLVGATQGVLWLALERRQSFLEEKRGGRERLLPEAEAVD